jgi:hypothetical protein
VLEALVELVRCPTWRETSSVAEEHSKPQALRGIHRPTASTAASVLYTHPQTPQYPIQQTATTMAEKTSAEKVSKIETEWKPPTNSCSLQRARLRRVSSTLTMTTMRRLLRPKTMLLHRHQPPSRLSPVCASTRRPQRYHPRSPRAQSTPRCRHRTR